MRKQRAGPWPSKTLTGKPVRIMPIPVDDKLHRRIKKKANNAGLSVAEYVRRAALAYQADKTEVM